MAMTPQIEASILGFSEIIFGGVPILLRQNETALLSFMCCAAAIDALSGYRYSIDNGGDRYKGFMEEYFPTEYKWHAQNLYRLRCRLLHNFSPAYTTLTHAQPQHHLGKSPIGATFLNDESFYSDVKAAAKKFFDEVRRDEGRQDVMNARLANLEKGGAIYY